MMYKYVKHKKVKFFALFLLLSVMLFTMAGCDFLLDLLGGGNADTPFDPKLRGDSITSTLFEAHLESIPEEERNDVLPVDSFAETVNLSGELLTGDYTSSIKVNNALEKLLDTVVAGKRPILSNDPENPVTRIWTAARAALNEFIHEDFDEYEITHTIYDWIVYYIDYDHALLDEYLENNGLVNGNNPAFHLSGAFLSGLAVCDGISKAFSLLCAMQGISVERVLGWYPNYNDFGAVQQYIGHAWNKVYIQVPGQTEKNWFFADPTFASAALYDGEIYEKTGKYVYTEYLNHAYFLLSDAQTTDHLQDDEWYCSGKNKQQKNGAAVYSKAVTEFDFYSFESNDSEEFPNPIVSSLAELDGYITNFAVSARVEGVEVKLNWTASQTSVDNQIISTINSLRGAGGVVSTATWFYCGKDSDVLMLIIVYKK